MREDVSEGDAYAQQLPQGDAVLKNTVGSSRR